MRIPTRRPFAHLHRPAALNLRFGQHLRKLVAVLGLFGEVAIAALLFLEGTVLFELFPSLAEPHPNQGSTISLLTLPTLLHDKLLHVLARLLYRLGVVRPRVEGLPSVLRSTLVVVHIIARGKVICR